MKICLISDTHAGCRSDSLIFNEYFLSFYREVFFPYLKDNKINTIIHLGDLFDRRKYVNFLTLNSWRKNVFEVLNSEFRTYILLGNHDCYHKNNNDINSLSELLGFHKNIHVISEPTEIEFGGTDVLLMPWISSSNEEECKEVLKTTRCQILMGHFDILGFEMYRGLLNREVGFGKEDFDRFDLVFSGHYHHKSTSENITYLGSPYEMIWSDYNDPKGFFVFDTDTREYEFVENPLRIFHKIYYNDTNKEYEDFVFQKETIKKDSDGNTVKSFINNLAKYKDCYVKIIIESKSNQYIFDRLLEALYKENPADVSILEANSDIDLSSDAIDETKDTLSLLVDYVESLGLADENKKPLIDLLKSLYMESQSIDV